MGPDSRYSSFGLSFGPNGQFSTHFGPNFMFLDLTELWPMWPIYPDGTRRALTSPDGRLDGPVSVYDLDMDPYGSPTSPDEPCRDQTGPNLMSTSDGV